MAVTGQLAYRNTMLPPLPHPHTHTHTHTEEQEEGGVAVGTAVLQLRGDTNPAL